MKTKEEFLEIHIQRFRDVPIVEVSDAINCMEEYAQQFNQWTSVKPDLSEECILVTATKIKDHWDYSVWCIEKVECDGSWYMGWLTGDGEEYGDLADLTADKYLILPKHS